MHFLPFYLIRFNRLAEAEDVNARRVSVGHQDGVARILVVEPRQLVQVRLIIRVNPGLFDGNSQLHRFKEIVRAGAGKYCDAICSRLHSFVDICNDALHVAIEALPLRGASRPRTR